MPKPEKKQIRVVEGDVVMNSIIHPSHAVLVRADTPIRECVALMRTHEVSSVLVTSDEGRDRLVGIFTERNLVNEFALIHTGAHWDRPVRTVMTSPVRTIPIERIDEAAELMLKHGFRNLPVTSDLGGDRPTVVGVISIRDVLEAMFVEFKQQRFSFLSKLGDGRAKIGIVTDDENLLKIFQKLFGSLFHAELHGIPLADNGDPAPFLKELASSAIIIFDIDGWDGKNWGPVLRAIHAAAPDTLTIVAFSPARHTRQAAKVLEKLAASRNFSVFAKPMDLMAFTQAIGARLRT